MPHPHTHKPTTETRATVRALSGVGIPQKDICRKIGIGKPTLQKHYRDELDIGIIDANAAVAQNLWKRATGRSAKSVIAAIFWMKVRLGWREVNFHEHSGADGGAIEVSDARAQLAELIARHKAAIEPIPKLNGQKASAEGATKKKRIPVRRRTS